MSGVEDKVKATTGKADGEAAAERYFRAIDAALQGLDTYLGDEQESPLYNHQLTGTILESYIDRMRQSFRAWEDRLAFSSRFRINRAESGYPLYQHVMELDKDARDANKQLAALPAADQLRKDMVDFILLKNKFPTEVQKTLAQRMYLEEVEGREVFRPFILPQSVKVGFNPKSKRPFYVVHWGAFDGAAHLPLVYVAVIEDSSDTMAKLLLAGGKLKEDLDIPFPIGGLLNPDLAHQFDDFCEKNSAYGLTLTTIADNMDKDFDHLHPTQLRRIVMGPFYSAGVTSHGGLVTGILDQVHNTKNAWMLTWTQQELYSISETPAKWGLFSSTPARQTYHIETGDLEAVRQGVSAYERHALVPHEAYQAIYASGKRDAVFGGYKTHVVSGRQVLRDF